MLLGRSTSDKVLPSGDAWYNSKLASWVGILLDRVILGVPEVGLGDMMLDIGIFAVSTGEGNCGGLSISVKLMMV